MAGKRMKRGSSRSSKFHRSGLGTAEHDPKQTSFVITVVWSAKDLTPHQKVTTDKRQALRIARSMAERGARIVLVKKSTAFANQKLIADFSTVGGAA